MKRLRGSAGLLLLLAGCEGAALPARRTESVYDFKLATTPPSVLRWSTGATVRVYVESAAAAERSRLTSALDAAMAEWNRHALYGEYRLVRSGSIADADVVLRWLDQGSQLDFSACEPAGARAVTTFCLTDPDPAAAELQTFPLADGTATEVRMVVSVLTSQQTIAGRVESLVTHELGHALGLAQHSDDERDLMGESQLTRTTLSARDIATIQTLYHTRPDVVP